MCFSRNIIRTVGHAWGEMRNACRILVGVNLMERHHFGEVVIEGRIILKWILRNRV
jgi:hypothetical protein